MCAAQGIPDYLHRHGRLEDSSFKPNEIIYRRFKQVGDPADWEKSKELASNVFPILNDSYNWSKYSQRPEDVLYNIKAINEDGHFFNWGIIGIEWGVIENERYPDNVEKPTKYFYVQAKHRPEECMYPHIELVIYDAETNLPVPEKPRVVRSLVRQYIIKSKIIIKECTL